MSSLRVALNGRFSGTRQPTGSQTAAFETFDAVLRLERDFEAVVYADPRHHGVQEWARLPLTRLVPLPLQDWSRARAQLWEQIVLPVAARRAGCVLMHHPMTTAPMFKAGIKSIVALHDLNFYHHPEWVSRSFRLWLMATAVPGIKHADHVYTISQHVRQDIRRTLNLDDAKLSVVYNGLKALPAIDPTPERVPARILGVNLWQPHKNLMRLLAAFESLRQVVPEAELHLAGRPQANFHEQPRLRERLDIPGVRLLGYLSDEDLSRAYSEATVMCFPSLEEGFGMPLLEAMAAGTSVVTSNASCLPEIAGGAAILVDPLSEESIREGLLQALQEAPDLRAERVRRGQARAAEFTWEAAALQISKLYHDLA